MRARDLVVAGVLVPLLVLGGCSDAEPQTTPVVSDPPASDASTPTEAGEATHSPPQIPATAEGSDELAAKAFVEYWFEVLTYAMKTGSAAQLNSFSDPSCISCSDIAKRISDVYTAGGRIETRGWAVEGQVRGPGYTDQRPELLLRSRQSSSRLFDESGDLVSRTPMSMTPIRIVLDRSASGWRVSVLEILR